MVQSGWTRFYPLIGAHSTVGIYIAGLRGIPYLKVVRNFCLIDPYFWYLVILLGSLFKKLDPVDALLLQVKSVSILFSSRDNVS